MSFLEIFGSILAAIGLVLLAAFLIITSQYLLFFKWRLCKRCNHNMEYKGLREDSDNGHYLFHCPHCGAWEQIPKEEFYREIDRGFNPNENML